MMTAKIVATILLILGLVFGITALALPALTSPTDVVAIIVFGAVVATISGSATPRSWWSLGLVFFANIVAGARHTYNNTTIASGTIRQPTFSASHNNPTIVAASRTTFRASALASGP